MSTPFLGEVYLFAFNFAPRGFATCDGQLLPINQNQALFALLGTIYGGDGITTFALPDLRGRVPLHFSGGFTQGASAGEAAHTLTLGELPSHIHVPVANRTANSGTQADPTGQFWANSGNNVYANSTDTTLAAAAVGNTGGGQPHENQSPFLVITACIALQGIFPSRN